MQQLIVCPGYDLNSDGSIPAILQNRLDECIKLLHANAAANLLLMGAASYRDEHSVSQAAAMLTYVVRVAPDIVSSRIMKEETSTSSVEQIYFLRRFTKTHALTIVASEYFINRIKLYAKYLLEPKTKVDFISSALPDDKKTTFETAEKVKLRTAQTWLKSHKMVGDHDAILAEQRSFLESFKLGSPHHPKGWVEHPRS